MSLYEILNTSTKKLLENKFKNELKELALLDKLKMLNVNDTYSKYNVVMDEKIESIYNIIDNNIYQKVVLLYNIDLSMNEYNELEDYEREFIDEEIYLHLDLEIKKMVEE